MPRRIRADDRPPSRKYFSPAAVADSESRYTVARIYTAKLCSSIERYIDTRSELDTRKLAPIVVNRISIEYSLTVGIAVVVVVVNLLEENGILAHPSSRIAPTVSRNISIEIERVVT